MIPNENKIIKAMRYTIIPSKLDYVNNNAKIIIVGKTPGSSQMGIDVEGLAPCEVKKKRAFAGQIRINLVKMLDYIHVNEFLDIDSCISLWADDYEDNADFTSILKNCVVDNNNPRHPFISSIPSMKQYREIKNEFEEGFARDCLKYSKAKLWVALGSDVEIILIDLQQRGIINSDTVIIPLPHPSGANAGRIAAFLGINSKKGTAEDKARAMAANGLLQVNKMISAKVESTN